jgi:hypothetical protein
VVFFSYTYLFIVTMLISVTAMLTSGRYFGELHFFELNVDTVTIIFITFINISLFVVVLLISQSKFFRLIRISNRYSVFYRHSRLNCFMLLILMSQLIFLFYTGVGIAGNNNAHFLSPIFSILSPVTFFPIYYLIFRNTKGYVFRFFVLNVILFVIFRLSQGWTSFILQFFILELFYRFDSARFSFSLKKVCLLSITPLILLLIGGLVYQPIYKLKNEIRGQPVDSITIVQSMGHLASRLSMLPISIGAYGNEDKVRELFLNTGPDYKEVVAIGRPILPSFIFTDKDFRSLNNNVLQSYYPSLTKDTSSNFGLFMYSYIIFTSDYNQFYMYLILLMLSTLFVVMFYNSLSVFKGQLAILSFLYLFNIVNNASLEMIFAYSFLNLFYIIFIFIFTGCIGFKSNPDKYG